MRNRKRKYCCVNGCFNSDAKDETLNFFQLPKEPERCKEWLTLFRREDLLNKEYFKNTSYVVCSAHFDVSAIKVVKQLKWNAMPHIDLPSQSQDGTTQTKPVKTRGKRFKKDVAEYKQNHLDQIKKNMNFVSCEYTDNKISRRFRNLIEWQNEIQNRNEGNRYNAEFMHFALNLNYCSPHAYRSLQTVLQLPSQSTLSRFKMNIPPRLDNRVLESLELKIKHLPDTARYCTICADVMELKKHLYYDTKTDEVIGFHNINGKKSPEIATKALIMMIQGMYFDWKQPIAYAFLASENHYEELDLWLKEVTSRLSGKGIKIKAIISDQGSYFDYFAKHVKMVTVDKPYFMYDDTKIYYIFDVPNLIKGIRNNLQTNDFSLDGEIVSWHYIKELYDDQKEKINKLITKITDIHIAPDKSNKMIKYALQIFSRTVSTALHTYINLDRISEEARPTANFIELMNDLFDVLNSNTIKGAFRLTNNQDKVLNYAQKIFANTKAIIGKSESDIIAHILTVGNFQISIKSIQMLYEDMKNEGFTYLFTRRLNHDNLKFFCRSIKQLSGSCDIPTPIHFQRAFSKLFLRNMVISSPDPNSELDICDILIKAEAITNIRFTSTPASSLASAVCLDGESDYRMDLPKNNALIYVSAYLLFKCFIKHKCPSTETILKSVKTLRETNLFTTFESDNQTNGFDGSLKMPPKEFIQCIQYLETAFQRNFEKVIHKNPGTQLSEQFNAITPQILCACFPVTYLVKLFIRLRIYTTLKRNSSYFKHCKMGIGKYINHRNL